MDSAKPAVSCYLASTLTMGPGVRRNDGQGGGIINRMRDTFQPCVYLLASSRHGTLYVGVTSNLLARVVQHREGLIPGFTRQYGVKLLVWYEVHDTMEAAILREKRLKGWRRAWKVDLIEARNEQWDDLAIGLGLARLPPASAGATSD